MKLKTQKQLLVAGLAVTGVSLAGYGLVHAFSGASSPSPNHNITVNQPPVTRTPTVANDEQQTISALEQIDLNGLHSHGYRVAPPTRAFGETCNTDGTTDGSGYHGSHTSISYDISKNGQTGKACITHDGNGHGHVTVKFDSAAQPVAPPPPAANGNDQALISTYESSDAQALGSHGYNVERTLSLGSTCYSDGTTDNSGPHGSTSAISYQVNHNGREGRACVAHNGQGTHGHVTVKMN